VDWINEFNKFLEDYKFTGEIKLNLPSKKIYIKVNYNNIEVNRNYTLDYFIYSIQDCLGNIRYEIFNTVLKNNTEEVLTKITNVNSDTLLELNEKFIKLRTNLLNLADAINDVVK
jgi:hypothetical protein